MKAHYLNEHCNEYNVTCNKVKVPKTGQNFTSLKVKVFPFFNTSLKVKVLKLLLKYSNALLLLRYCTTLCIYHPFNVSILLPCEVHKNAKTPLCLNPSNPAAQRVIVLQRQRSHWNLLFLFHSTHFTTQNVVSGLSFSCSKEYLNSNHSCCRWFRFWKAIN